MRKADEAEQDMNAHLKLQERKCPGRMRREEGDQRTSSAAPCVPVIGPVPHFLGPWLNRTL